MEGELVWQVEFDYVWTGQHTIRKTRFEKLPSEAFVRFNGRGINFYCAVLVRAILKTVHTKFVFECEGIPNDAAKDFG